jgi:hypothetical protein
MADVTAEDNMNTIHIFLQKIIKLFRTLAVKVSVAMKYAVLSPWV